MQDIELTITIKGLDAQALVRILAAAQGEQAIRVAATPKLAAASDDVPKGKPGRPKDTEETKAAKAKAAKAKAKVEDEDEDEDEAADEDDDGDESEEDDDGDGEDEDEDEGRAKKGKKDKDKKSSTEIKLDHVLKAFSDYTDKHGRDAATKILKKYDVKVIRNAPEKLWPKLVKALRE